MGMGGGGGGGGAGASDFFTMNLNSKKNIFFLVWGERGGSGEG